LHCKFNQAINEHVGDLCSLFTSW